MDYATNKIKASEWNRLLQNINDVRTYCSLSEYIFPANPIAGDTFTATYWNSAIDALSELNAYYTAPLPYTHVTGDRLMAAYFEQIKDCINSIVLVTYVFRIKTDNVGYNHTDDHTFRIPTVNPAYGGTYDATVDWGDGNTNVLNAWDNVSQIQHTYADIGEYDISITGQFEGWNFLNAIGDYEKMLEIKQWGVLDLYNSTLTYGIQNFAYCLNLTVSATDLLDLSNNVSLAYAFAYCEALTTVPNMGNWDFTVSSITSLEYMFYGCTLFNQDLSGWNTSAITTMDGMFEYCTNFEQSLAGWDIGLVTTMVDMFDNAGINTSNYDATLISWASQSVQDNVVFDAGSSKCSIAPSSAFTARNHLINVHNWVITDIVNNTIMTFQTDSISGGSSNDHQVRLPLQATGTYDFVVDWGDGNQDTITVYNQAERTHTYADIGIYTITISGMLYGFGFGDSGDKLKIRQIQQWGDSFRLGTTGYRSFYNCTNLSIVTDDILVLTDTTSLQLAFANCHNLTANYAMSLWDTSTITIMQTVFADSANFDEDLSAWDTSNVTNMSLMFGGCESFNHYIGLWDTANVIDMGGMFNSCITYNQDLSAWDTTNVTDMSGMFWGATLFNQDISSWNTSSVTDMSFMFDYAIAFEQNLASWNITNVTDMSFMFNGVTLTKANYDALLVGWGAQAVQYGVEFDGGNSRYSAGSAAATARAHLISDHGWSITDGGSI
jgi:surface protein